MDIKHIKASLVRLDDAITALEQGYSVYSENLRLAQRQLEMFEENKATASRIEEDRRKKIVGHLDKAIQKAEAILYAEA